MFQNQQININKIISIVLEYPRQQKSCYPLHVDYSSTKCFPTHELFIYLDGKSRWTLGDTTYEMSKGDIVLIPKGTDQKNYHVTVLEPVTFVNIYFLCDDISHDNIDCNLTALRCTENNSTNCPVSELHKSHSDSLCNKFLKIGKIWLAKGDNYYTASMSLLYDIISSIRTEQNTYFPASQYRALRPSIDYMEKKYYCSDFDYKEMAALSGYSYSYFKKQFIKKYGCSPVKHVTGLRVSLACELLVTDRYQITEIAEMCGFENVQYFSSTFKKATGVSPSRYQQAP